MVSSYSIIKVYNSISIDFFLLNSVLAYIAVKGFRFG